MSDDNRVSILICTDAGSASTTLLARVDLRIRWALTKAEAVAVVRNTTSAVVITRAALASDVLAECAKSQRSISSIVLLEPSQWSSWREYFEAGATSVLRASAADELLDALTDVTGAAFRTAPPVPFKTHVRFVEGGGDWTSLNLSSSSICIIDFPPYALGSEVDLVFEIEGTELELNAIISQIFRVGPYRAVGLSFGEVSTEVQTRINEYTSRMHAKQQVTEQVASFDSLDDNTLSRLRSATVQGDTLQLIRTLTTDGTVPAHEHAAPWVVQACASMSPMEKQSIRAPKSAPQWAQDALLGRLRAFEARSRAGAGPPTENDVREVFGLCQRLAEGAASSDEQTLVQVTNIRGEILRALYDPELLIPSEM